MKCCKKYILAVSLSIPFLSGIAVAEEAQTQTGFHGDIMIGGLWRSSDSQLVPLDDNKKISSLKTNGDTESESNFLGMGNLSYTTLSGTQFFISGQKGLSAGISQEFEDVANVTVAAVYLPTEVWEDPYLTGTNRNDTDETRVGGNVAFDAIMGTGLNLGYTYMDVDVDDDLIGRKNALLKRNGATHTVVSGYTFQLGASNTLTPQLQYEAGDFDGESNSYDSWGRCLTHTYTNAYIVMENTVSWGTAEYDRIHPLFNKTRDEDTYGISSTVTWLNPLGYENFSVTAIGSYATTDSNIDFFDSTDIMVGMGIGYRF